MLISAQDGSVISQWDHRKMNVNFHTSVADKGVVYGITWDKKKHHLDCFDLNTGKDKWNRKLDDWGAFSVAGDYILLIEADGTLSVLEAGSQSYKVVSKARVLKMENREKAPDDQPVTCWTSPVLCNGRIYVRNTYGEIACVDMRM